MARSSNKNTPILSLPEPVITGSIKTFTVDHTMAQVIIPEFNTSQIRLNAQPWVPYGVQNRFSDYLMESVRKSSRHSAYIKLRESFIKGGKRGAMYSDNIKDFMENLDGQGATINEMLDLWAPELAILETFASWVRYSKDGKTIAAIDHLDSSKVRPAWIRQTPEEIEAGELPVIKGYWVSNDWSNTSRCKPVYYEKFALPEKGKRSTSAVQIFFSHKRAGGQPYFPEVSYVSCLNYVELENEIGKFGLSKLINGFYGNCIVELKKSMTTEQKEQFEQEMHDTFTGSENNSKMIVVIDEQENTVKVTPLDSVDNTPMLTALKTMAGDSIDTAHRCQPTIAGVVTPTGFQSGAEFIRAAQNAFRENVIVDLQKAIFSFFAKVFRFNGITDDYEFTIHEVDLSVDPKPVSPDWLEQNRIKTSALARKYNWALDDILPQFLDAVVPDNTEITDPGADGQVN